jgi:hypothetical protein
MKCERCGVNLEEVETNSYQGKILCEDCCFDLTNSPKVCDPIAVSSTLSVRRQLEQKGTDGLTELQKQIYQKVIEEGTMCSEDLAVSLKISHQELEKQFVILRHCQLLRAFKEGSTIYLTKFS